MSNKGGCPFYGSDKQKNHCKVPTIGERKKLNCEGFDKKCQDIEKALEYCRKMKAA